MLGAIWACNRGRQYASGRTFATDVPHAVRVIVLLANLFGAIALDHAVRRK